MEREGVKKIIHTSPNILEGNGVMFKTLPLIIYDYKCLLFICRIFINFFFQNDDQLLIKFHEILTAFFLDEQLKRSTFYD